MEADSILLTLPGVRQCWTGTTHDRRPSAQPVIANAAALVRELVATGDLLGFGAPTCVSCRGAASSWVIATRDDRLIALDVDPTRPVTAVESAVASLDWSAVPPPRASEPTAPPPLPPPPVAPPVASPMSGRTELPVTPQGSAVELELFRLRRALASGDTAQAEVSIGRLRALPREPRGPHHRETSHDAIHALLSGIAKAVAGDNAGALKAFAAATLPELRPTIRWSAQLWGARAALQMIDRTATATSHADAAMRTSLELDSEARAVSTLVKAEVTFAVGEPERALELAGAARALIGTSSDHVTAESWLLEARCLVALGDLGGAMRVAGLSLQIRPTRPTVGFLIMTALATSDLDQAEQILARASGLPALPELDRERRLLGLVHAGVLPADDLVELLQLVYLPPTASTLHQLRDLASAFPAIEDIREILGWKLLRGGAAALARPIFEELALSPLPDDLRTAVTQANATLATVPPDRELGVRRNTPARALPAVTTGRVPTAEAGRPPPSSASVFSGTLQTFHLPDLLEFLRGGRKSGTLMCTSAHGTGAIQLRNGKICEASGPTAPHLADLLVAHQVITPDQIQLTDGSDGWDPQRRFASKLVRDGVATVAQVHDALRAQIHEAVAGLLTWTEGEFSFDPTTPRESFEHEALAIQIDSQMVLLEIFARQDESSAGR